MARQINKNRGFTLVELLISITILSIVMLMVVQFMSTSAGAQRKTQKNIRCQVVADETMNRLADDLMSATYIRVEPEGATAYTIKNAGEEASRDTTYTAVNSGDKLTTDQGYDINFQLVSDNYPNYAKSSGADERKVNINMDTYEIVDEVSQKPYPIAGDRDESKEEERDAHSTLRSFRVLKQSTSTGTAQYYVKPKYIYLEYKRTVTATGGSLESRLCNVIYYFDYANHSIYMKRNDENTIGLTENTVGRFHSLKGVVATTGIKGRLTDAMKDFYLSADAEGNAILLNSIFEVEEYRMNVSDTVKFRNSNVLTTRPQITNRYIPGAGGTGGGAGSGGTGDGGTGSGDTGDGGTGSGDTGDGGTGSGGTGNGETGSGGTAGD